jgi:hypothetical protein
LPNFDTIPWQAGKITDSLNEFYSAWNDIIQKACDLFPGWELHSFDSNTGRVTMAVTVDDGGEQKLIQPISIVVPAIQDLWTRLAIQNV